MSTIRIATRKSELALAQSMLVGHGLQAGNSELPFELVHVITSGDRKQGTPQASQSDKRDWVLEIEHTVLRGEADFAVHSGKDVPLLLEEGTSIAPALSRDFPLDALLVAPRLKARGILAIQDLPHGACVGTASLRRQAHLRRIRPDLDVQPLRGNVTSRLQRLLEESQFDAIVLAAAGLVRLGLSDHIGSLIPADLVLPAVSQGTLVLQWRTDDLRTQSLLRPLTIPNTVPPFIAEREVISILGADCKSAVSSYAELVGSELRLRARVLSVDGGRCLEAAESGNPEDPLQPARRVAASLLKQGAAELLQNP